MTTTVWFQDPLSDYCKITSSHPLTSPCPTIQSYNKHILETDSPFNPISGNELLHDVYILLSWSPGKLSFSLSNLSNFHSRNRKLQVFKSTGNDKNPMLQLFGGLVNSYNETLESTDLYQNEYPSAICNFRKIFNVLKIHSSKYL